MTSLVNISLAAGLGVWLLAASITFVPWTLAPIYWNLFAAIASVPGLVFGRRWIRAAAIIVLALSLCGTYSSYNYVQEYRQAHPGWNSVERKGT